MSWEEAGGAGNARKGYCRFRLVLGRDRGFLVTIEFLVCVTTWVLFIETWFLGCKQLLGRDIVFSCCDMISSLS